MKMPSVNLNPILCFEPFYENWLAAFILMSNYIPKYFILSQFSNLPQDNIMEVVQKIKYISL